MAGVRWGPFSEMLAEITSTNATTPRRKSFARSQFMFSTLRMSRGNTASGASCERLCPKGIEPVEKTKPPLG